MLAFKAFSKTFAQLADMDEVALLASGKAGRPRLISPDVGLDAGLIPVTSELGLADTLPKESA